MFEKWHTLSFCEQMGNVGAEFSRFSKFSKSGDQASRDTSAQRLFDLLDRMISDRRWNERLSELTRLREVLADLYCETQWYKVSLEDMEKYFLPFAFLARARV